MSDFVNSYAFINSYTTICPSCNEAAVIAVYGNFSRPDEGEHACTRCGFIWDKIVNNNSEKGQTSYRPVPRKPAVYPLKNLESRL